MSSTPPSSEPKVTTTTATIPSAAKTVSKQLRKSTQHVEGDDECIDDAQRATSSVSGGSSEGCDNRKKVGRDQNASTVDIQSIVLIVIILAMTTCHRVQVLFR